LIVGVVGEGVRDAFVVAEKTKLLSEELEHRPVSFRLVLGVHFRETLQMREGTQPRVEFRLSPHGPLEIRTLALDK